MDRSRNTRMPWIIVLFLVIIACVGCYIAAYLFRGLSHPEKIGSYKALSVPAGAEVRVAGNGFVYYDGSTLTRVDSSGKTKWSCLVGADADFNAGAYGVAAWSGEMLTLIDMETGTFTYSGTQNAEILSARMGQKYAAVLLGPDEAGAISVIEPGGREVYRALFDQVTVMDFDFFSSGSLMWVMALDCTGSVPTCDINTYKPSSMRIVGAISDTEQLMYNVTFQTAGICATGVTYMKTYDYTGMEDAKKRKLVYGWHLTATDDCDDPLMVFVPAGQQVEKVQDIRLIRGGEDRMLRMPFPCMALTASGDKVFGFSKDGHVMRAMLGAQKVDAYSLPFSIDKVYGVTDDNKAVISAMGAITLVSMGE